MTLAFDQLPVLYQSEALAHVPWWGERGLQTTTQQLENDLKHEALRIWQEEKHNQDNILRHLAPDNDRRDTVIIVFERLLKYKREWKFGEGVDEAYYKGRQISWVFNLSSKQFQSWSEENQQLDQQIKELTIQTNLLQQISLKKFQRKQLLSNLNPQNNPNLTFWLNELITTTKKPNNLQNTILENIQNKLEELGTSQKQIQELIELQQNISKLKQELQSEIEQNQQTQIVHQEPILPKK